MRFPALVAVLATLLSATACAQLSGDIAVVSDYRYRGVSLSSNDPAVQGGVSFDARSGFYAGAFASTIDPGFIESNALVQAYAGFARHVGESSWDAGASFTTFPGDREYDFAELHIGWTHDKGNVAVHYAPDYFGRRVHAAYAEANVAFPLAVALPLRIRAVLVGHAGLLYARPSGGDIPGTRATRFDARGGIALNFQSAKLELAWVAGDSPVGFYPVRRDSRRSTLVATLSHAF